MSECEQLIALHLPAARRGDRQAFSALVAATQNTVTSLALAIVRDVQHSEDIAQEAYLAVWKRLKTLRNPDSFLPWLRQITRNLARDHLRQRKSRPGDVPDSADSINSLDNEAAGEKSSEEMVTLAQQDQLIREALDGLPDESREVLILFYREDQSSRQVARLLGLSDSAVRKRLSRARSGLRAELEETLGATLMRTVPGMGFTALVGSLLLSASPPAAAGVLLAAGAKSGVKLVFGLGLGLLVALAGGIVGVILGLRPAIQSSTNAAELAALKRFRVYGVIVVVLGVAGFLVSSQLHGWLPVTLVFVLFMTAIGIQHIIILPRILAERSADPRTARYLTRQKFWAWLGLIGGGLGGLVGLIAGLLTSGRISF